MASRLPAQMTAIAITAPGAPEVLKPVILPRPEPGPGELLIAVKAAGVNRPDLLQRQGHYPPPPGAPETPGLEIAGEVVALGPKTQRFRQGEQVMALVSGGGYAAFCLAAEACTLPLPKSLSWIEGAAIPETFFTVWTNVFEAGALKEGESLLVHGGTSGIGTAAILLGHAFGAKVYATAGTDEKCRAIASMGATAINYRTTDFVAAIQEATGGRGVDVVLDMVGGAYVARNIKCLAEFGRHVSIAVLGGSKAEINIREIMTKRIVLTGSTLRPRNTAEKGRIAAALEEKVLPLLARGRIRPVIDRTYPLAKAAEAHRRMEASAHIGKIVLTVE